MNLYPLKFHPIFKEKLWGGSKLRDLLHKDCGNIPHCGESWEISGVDGNVSVVSNGPLEGRSLKDLIREYKGALLGDSVYKAFGNDFPLLIKFIDANDDLSIQVHPDDDLALKRHNSKGKTEMWYIMQADTNSTLISGFNRSTNRDEYLEFLKRGKLTELLNVEKVSKGDVYYLPAGRVHTIGKGLLLAEIQQTSDVTYRIYDFDRIDKNGNKRYLQTEEALDALDFQFHSDYKTSYDHPHNSNDRIIQGDYFETAIHHISHVNNLELNDHTFAILIAVEGSSKLNCGEESMVFDKGQTILIPACIQNITIESNSPEGITFLETHIPQ